MLLPELWTVYNQPFTHLDLQCGWLHRVPLAQVDFRKAPVG